MIEHTPPSSDQTVTQAGLERELQVLATAWRCVEESEVPAHLTTRTMARLGEEGLLQGSAARTSGRVRWSAMAGMAAALALVTLGSLHPLNRTSVVPASASWAEGLVLDEEFESIPHELEVRLDRVQHLLVEEREEEWEAPGEGSALRQRMEGLAGEMEAF